MERCARFHRFLGILLLSGGFAVLSCAANANALPARNTTAPRTATERVAAGGAGARKTPQESAQQTRRTEYTLSRDRYEKAVTYSRAAYTLYFVSVFVTLLTLVLLLHFGIAARYRDWAENVSDTRQVQALIFVPLLLVTLAVVVLPLHIFGHVLSIRYQMSVQGWGSWFFDWSKEEILVIGLALLLALLLSAAMRRSARRWWLYFWFASIPVLLFLVFISPWFVDPLFNTFEPLQKSHPDLVAAITKLTNRAGVPISANRMFLMRASEKTNEVNAYVTGFGASKRVVVWDTTIRRASLNETLFIVGHELGHYVLGHVWKGLLFFAVFLFIGFYVLFRVLQWALGRWSGQWRIYGQEDWASFTVVVLLVYLGMFLTSPVVNGFSRMQEHDADVYGLEVIHGIIPDSAEVAAHSFQVLGEADLADPNPPPFIIFWLYSHPPLAERLAFADSYDPWERAEAPKYVK